MTARLKVYRVEISPFEGSPKLVLATGSATMIKKVNYWIIAENKKLDLKGGEDPWEEIVSFNVVGEVDIT